MYMYFISKSQIAMLYLRYTDILMGEEKVGLLYSNAIYEAPFAGDYSRQKIKQPIKYFIKFIIRFFISLINTGRL